MPSVNRRAFLASSGAALIAASGCTAPNALPTPAHWVTVYLGERDETHNVTVLITNESGDTLFEKDYQLSDYNEANEDAPFPESTEPETIVVTVDGTRFERDWPGFEHPELPCDGQNWSGVEIWIESGQDGPPDVRIEGGCQHVTMD